MDATPLNPLSAPGGARSSSSHRDAATVAELMRERAGARRASKTRKSAVTREKILSATLALVSEQGTTNIRMSEVAARCGMSKGALYYYFSDRNDIIHELVERNSEALVVSLERAAEGCESAHDAIHALCAVFVEHLRLNQALIPTLLSNALAARASLIANAESRFERVFRVVQQQLERGVGEGFLRDDLDLELAASAACGAFIIAAVEQVGRHGLALDTERLVDKLVDMCLRGVMSERALQGGACRG